MARTKEGSPKRPTADELEQEYRKTLEEVSRYELANDYITADEAEHRAWALVAMYKTLYGEELPENND